MNMETTSMKKIVSALCLAISFMMQIEPLSAASRPRVSPCTGITKKLLVVLCLLTATTQGNIEYLPEELIIGDDPDLSPAPPYQGAVIPVGSLSFTVGATFEGHCSYKFVDYGNKFSLFMNDGEIQFAKTPEGFHKVLALFAQTHNIKDLVKARKILATQCPEFERLYRLYTSKKEL